MPTDSRLPNSGKQLCGLYDLKPALFGRSDLLARPDSDFGDLTKVYNGFEVTMNARFGQGGSFTGGVSMGRTVEDNCVVVDSPQDAREGFCKVSPPWSAGTGVGITFVYPLPFDIRTSAIYQNSPGIPITAQLVVPNAAIVPSLGRNLSACPPTGACNANVTVDVIEPRSMFEQRLQQLDLRLSRTFQLGGSRRLRGNFDVYNVLNASNVLNMNTLVRHDLDEREPDSQRPAAPRRRAVRFLDARRARRKRGARRRRIDHDVHDVTNLNVVIVVSSWLIP